jgi:hypothetical protein
VLPEQRIWIGFVLWWEGSSEARGFVTGTLTENLYGLAAMERGDMRLPHPTAKVLPPASSLYDCPLYGMPIAYPTRQRRLPLMLVIEELPARNG